MSGSKKQAVLVRMNRDQYGTIIKTYRSCGGPNLDPETLEVWYRLLCDLDPEVAHEAVVQIVKTTQDLATLNFVAEVRTVSKAIAMRKRTERKELPPAPPTDQDKEDFKAMLAECKRKIAKMGGEQDE